MKRTVWILGAILAACGPKVTVQTLNPAPYPMAPRPAAAVAVFTTGIPDRPYVEVALLSAERGQSDEHLPALRERAAEMGCDALVFTSISRTSTTSDGHYDGKLDTTSTVSGSNATCIVWTTP